MHARNKHGRPHPVTPTARPPVQVKAASRWRRQPHGRSAGNPTTAINTTPDGRTPAVRAMGEQPHVPRRRRARKARCPPAAIRCGFLLTHTMLAMRCTGAVPCCAMCHMPMGRPVRASRRAGTSRAAFIPCKPRLWLLPPGPVLLGPVWHGSTLELQQLQQKFQPNTPAPKLLGAANSMEL